MKAGVDAPEPALEQGGEGSRVASGSGVAGFFSAPVGRFAASHMPVDTAQNSAKAMTRMRRSSRPGSLIWLSSSPKPRLLKSENRGRVGRRNFTSGLYRTVREPLGSHRSHQAACRHPRRPVSEETRVALPNVLDEAAGSGFVPFQAFVLPHGPSDQSPVEVP